MRRNRWLSLMIFLPVASGCIPLPAPSVVSVNDRLELGEHPRASEDKVLIAGSNFKRRLFSSSFSLFYAFCRDDAYRGDTIGRLSESLYAANPTLLGPKGLADKIGGQIPADGENWRAPDDLARELSEAHVRYVVYVNEDVDTTVLVPLWIPLFGVAACNYKTNLEARIWELPSGKFLGSVSTTARGEFLVVSYLVSVIAKPDTQSRARARLADELLQKLAAEGTAPAASSEILDYGSRTSHLTRSRVSTVSVTISTMDADQPTRRVFAAGAAPEALGSEHDDRECRASDSSPVRSTHLPQPLE